MVNEKLSDWRHEAIQLGTLIRVVFTAMVFSYQASGQVADAASNVVVWDSSESWQDGMNFVDRSGWKPVPVDLLSLEVDPVRAARDPAFYGREYDFRGDVVVENRNYLVVFRSAGGIVSVLSKAQSVKTRDSPNGIEIPIRSVAELKPLLNSKVKRTTISRVSLLRNTGDEAVLEVFYSDQKGGESTAVFVFDRSEIVEVHPSGVVIGMRLSCPMKYGIIPDFIGDDLLFSEYEGKESRLNLPSENMFLGLLRGENRVLVMTWPKGEQKLSLGLGAEKDGSRPLESIDFENDGKGFFFATLVAPGIWHGEELKPGFLEKDVKIQWRRPFEAKWVTQLNEAGVKTRYAFKESGGQIWRGVPGMYSYPVWFEGGDTMFHLSKKVAPRGNSLIYFLEGRSTPLSIQTPVEILKATLGRQFSRGLLDDAGRKLRTHHRRGGEGVRRSCTCGATEAIEAVFKTGQEVGESGYIGEALDDMSYFVERHLDRIDEYLEFGDGMTKFLKKSEQTAPELKPFIEEVAWMAAQIREEYEVQKENMKSMEYAQELTSETLSLTKKKDPGNHAAYMKLFKNWRAMGGAQDYLLARCHATVRRLAQESGYACMGRPEAVKLAEQIRMRCRKVLRNPDGYEIWADY